jgi:transglutaminase-like putative cysteine protease
VRVVVQHRSRYHYPRPALLGPQLIRLRPADHTRARIESYQLLVEPEHRVHWLRDPHGNRVARVTFKAGQRSPSSTCWSSSRSRSTRSIRSISSSTR